MARPHSLAQALQASAQNLHISPASSLLPAMSATAVEQTCAQSMSSAMQRVIILTSGSWRQDAAQCWQATTQALQAAMQSR